MTQTKIQNEGIIPSVKNSFNTISDKNNTDSKSSLYIIATSSDDNVVETPPKSWLDQSPPFATYCIPNNSEQDSSAYEYLNFGTEQEEKVESEYSYSLQKLISNAVAEKEKQLGLDSLSYIQTKLVSKTVVANYKPKKREWIKTPSPEYLELIETKQYKTAYRKIKKALDRCETKITINQRYALASHIAAYDLGIEILISWQDMKAGKSFAYGWMMDFHPAMKNGLSLCHLEAINLSNATARNNDSKERNNNDAETNAVYHDVKKGKNLDYPSVHSTWQGERKVKNQMNVEGYSINLIDESEGASHFITSDVIDKRWQVIQSIRETIKNNDFTILTDAHVGKNTYRLAALLTNRPVFTIENTYKIWRNIKGYVIEEFESGLKNNIEELKKAIANSNKVGSFFASAEDAKYSHNEIKKELKLTDEEFPLITSKTGEKDLIKKIKKNPELFKNLVGFCASPSLGIGISIEVEEYLTAYLYAKDGDTVGDSKSQVQMLFRLREIKSIILVKCYDASMEKMDKRNLLRLELNDILQKQAIADLIMQSAINDNSELAQLRYSAQSDLYRYDCDIRVEYIIDCLSRFENIESLLESKGINLMQVTTLSVSDYAKKLTRWGKEALKTEEIIKQSKIEIITPDEAKELVSEKRKNNNRISKDKGDQLKIYTIAKNLLPLNKDVSTVPALAIQSYNNGSVKRRDNLQMAMATKKQIKTIVKAHAFGVLDYNKKKLQFDLADLSPEKMLMNYKHDSYLAGLLNISTDESGYVLNIGGIVNVDNMHGRSKKKIIKTINDAIERRNALKLNGGLESKIKDDGMLSKQIKKKIEGRLGVRFKACKKTPTVTISKKVTPKAPYFDVLSAVFGKLGKKIRANQVTAEDVLKSDFVELITEELRGEVNKGSKYKITRANAKKNPLRALKRILDVAKIQFNKSSISNGYQVENHDYDAQFLADIAREKEHNETANLLAYIESIGKPKN